MEFDFKIPASAALEFRLHDARNQHPCARVEYLAVGLAHNAKIHIDVRERGFHALAHRNAANRKSCLTADNQIELCISQHRAAP